MSHESFRTPHAPKTTFLGIPTGSAIGIVFAAVFTGALVSVYTETVGWPYLTLFAIAALVVTTLVNPKGLYLTVASSPILYVAGVLAAGWLIARTTTTTEGTGVSKASIVAILYPFIQYFPVLLTVTLGTALIGYLRYVLVRRQNAMMARRDLRARRRDAAANRRTNRQSRRARERTNSVTVDELLQRSKESAARRARSQHRRMSEDLYEN